VISHPWVSAAGADRRAIPVAAHDARGAVIEGVIDLVREDPEGLVAVRIALADGDPSEALRAEAVLAAEALADATGKRVRAALLLA